MIARISQIATRAARWGQNSQRNLHKVQWPGIRQVDRRPGFHRDATKPVCCESSCGSRLLLLWRKNGSRFCDSPVSFLGGEQRHHSHVGIASGIYGQCSGCRGDFVGIFYDRPAVDVPNSKYQDSSLPPSDSTYLTIPAFSAVGGCFWRFLTPSSVRTARLRYR